MYTPRAITYSVDGDAIGVSRDDFSFFQLLFVKRRRRIERKRKVVDTELKKRFSFIYRFTYFFFYYSIVVEFFKAFYISLFKLFPRVRVGFKINAFHVKFRKKEKKKNVKFKCFSFYHSFAYVA